MLPHVRGTVSIVVLLQVRSLLFICYSFVSVLHFFLSSPISAYSIEYTQGRRIGWMRLVVFVELCQFFHSEWIISPCTLSEGKLNNKCVYWHVGHVVSAIDKSDLDQVLSRKRPSSRWDPPFDVVFARCALPCSSLPTLPGSAWAVLASSPCGGAFSCFLVKISNSLFVRTDTKIVLP